MARLTLMVIVLTFYGTQVFSQSENEFLGLLKINDTAVISYRLHLGLTGDKVTGYSVTNIGGAHETKSYVKGSYDAKTNWLVFEEYGIEYTKSNVDTYDFCFVHFEGKLKNLNKQNVVQGKFVGKYSDGVSCINGDLLLRSIDKIYKTAKRTDKKIQRTKKIADSVKGKVNLTKVIDDQRLNLLKANEVTTVFATADKVKLTIWDAGKIDGDAITITFNDKTVLNNFTINKVKEELYLKLDKEKNSIRITANNLGEIHPNTAKIVLTLGKRRIDLFSNLKTTETTEIAIVKK